MADGIPVLAVDIPSGVEGDTGRATGAVLAATATVTFVALKPGLVQGDGARLAGDVRVVDIGLPIDGYDIAVVGDDDVASVGASPAIPEATSGWPPSWWWPGHRA